MMNECAITVKKKVLSDKLAYWILVFFVGCFIGWIYEEIFYWISEGVLRNRGILYGPWLPIYGVGALGIYAMKPLKKYLLIMFFMCVCITGIIEYIIGFIGIHYFDLRLWDYRGLFLNVEGIVCFRSVVSFGVMGLIFHYYVEPIAEKLFEKTRPLTINYVTLIIVLIFFTDCVISWLYRTPIMY